VDSQQVIQKTDLKEKFFGLGKQREGGSQTSSSSLRPGVSPNHHSGAESLSPDTSSGVDTPAESDYGFDTPPVNTSKLYRSLSNRTLTTAESHTDMAAPAFLSPLSRLQSHLQPTVVQLDDLEFSDDDLDDVEPVTRTIRRLPAARNLRLATTLRDIAMPLPLRNSTETMSSLASFPELSRRHSIDQSPASFLSTASTDEGWAGLTVIHNFVVEGLDSDEEDAGDVEAALRRLEGQIDEDKQKELAKRVEHQMSKSKAVEASKRLTSNAAGGASGSDDGDADSLIESSGSRGRGDDPEPSPAVPGNRTSEQGAGKQSTGAGSLGTQPSFFAATMKKTEDVRADGRSPPGMRRISRKPSMRKLFPGNRLSATARAASLLPLPLPPLHRSFLLFHKTEDVATQFALIERDLLCSISWHELVEGVWRDREGQLDVLDWEAFLKRRARHMVEARARGEQPRANAVQASVVRFNIVALWVGSEIVLTTSLDERVVIVAKYIRLAWVSRRGIYFISDGTLLTRARCLNRNAIDSLISRLWLRLFMVCSRLTWSGSNALGREWACGRCECSRT
jgi:RasGEF domain